MIKELFSFFFIVTMFTPFICYAADDDKADANNWGCKLIKSPIGLGIDVQTKYMWRGMEMMPEDSAPVLFPSLNYTYKGFLFMQWVATQLMESMPRLI